MALTPEGKVKAAVRKVLKENNVWFFQPMQNGMGVVGIPDFVCCYKGIFLAIETKAPGKIANVTPNQRRVIENIRDANGFAWVVDDPADLGALFNAIDAYLVLEPRNVSLKQT